MDGLRADLEGGEPLKNVISVVTLDSQHVSYKNRMASLASLVFGCVPKVYILVQSSPSHPLLILATSHCKPAELPPLLTSFFGGGSSVGKKSAAASVVVLDAELPLREVQRAETSIEHLLQRRMDTASTRDTNVEKESAAASEIRASARAPSCLPAFNAAEKERGRSILAQVCQPLRSDKHVERYVMKTCMCCSRHP